MCKRRESIMWLYNTIYCSQGLLLEAKQVTRNRTWDIWSPLVSMFTLCWNGVKEDLRKLVCSTDFFAFVIFLLHCFYPKHLAHLRMWFFDGCWSILQALLVVPCRAVGWCRYNCCGLFTVQTLGPLGQSASRNSTRFVWESQLGLSTSVHKTNRTNSSKYSKLDSRTLNGPQQ